MSGLLNIQKALTFGRFAVTIAGVNPKVRILIEMIKLYNFPLSGNGYKARLLMSILNVEYETIAIDLRNKEHKTPAFLEINPWGQVPVLMDGDLVLRDSQAILVYLAQRYGGAAWLPSDPASWGLVMQWLSTAANDIRQGFAAARAYNLLGKPTDIEVATAYAYETLKIFDKHLAHRQWLELDRPTLADLACFPYIAMAADGKISLAGYGQVLAWIDRIQQLPGYIALPGQ
jgi:glutathione S-transferase